MDSRTRTLSIHSIIYIYYIEMDLLTAKHPQLSSKNNSYLGKNHNVVHCPFHLSKTSFCPDAIDARTTRPAR